MSDHTFEQQIREHAAGMNDRRRELRALLLTAADAARQTRRIRLSATRAARPIGRAVRDRISTLLSAAV